MSFITKTKSFNSRRGFTLLEILLVVGIIAILAGIVILAINPTKQLGDARNAQRRSDVLTILNAVYQFSIDNSGKLPTDTGLPNGTAVIPDSIDEATACAPDTSYSASNKASEIMASDSAQASAVVNLYTSLIHGAASSTYLVSMPRDPSTSATTDDTGYHIIKTSGGRVTVCAPMAENSAAITVTR